VGGISGRGDIKIKVNDEKKETPSEFQSNQETDGLFIED